MSDRLLLALLMFLAGWIVGVICAVIAAASMDWKDR